ncbi:putative reverse transcriptase domain, reverse transcriptase zinc-binding domain protein [Tanacetum coccineum]
MDVQRTGLQFTWNQKPKGKDGILRKLDRVLANLEFLDSFVGAHAIFKPYRILDHSSSVLSIPSRVKEKPKPFKIFNVVLLDDRFKDMVRNRWLAQVSGFYMFRVVKKLKGLKKPIRKLMYDKGNLLANVVQLREELDKVLTDLDNDPSNLSFQEKEAATVAAFNEALIMEEKFLKQKAKITWLREGDSNTAYFHKVVKSRVSRCRIDVVTDANGVVYHNNDVAKAFINHYEVFLGQPGNTSDFNTDNLFPTRLNDSEALNMVRDISSQEVKSAMFSMGNDKSPVDIQKAYDTVDWNFLRVILIGFGFHERMIAWIMECVTTTSFSISINGSLHGYFKGKRGLRQELDLINLCFADDLFLFVHGDVNSAKNRVNDWKTKSLSIVGRLQLIQSVLGSLHVYWASVFMLPTRVLLDIEQIMRGFLWCHSMCKGKAKVAWDVVCLPKQEGGLCVRRLDHFNKALIVSHVWKLLSLKESLWVNWRKLLLLRPLIRGFIWSCIGDGKTTSIWFDKWCVASPLSNIISSRDIARAGFTHASKVRDCIPVPTIIDDNPDSLEWRSRDGIGKPFSVHNVWDSIRPRDNLVSWYDFVWFHACIPRHAFNMWLIFKQRLRTQDCLRSWEVVAGLAVVCPLCETQPDSHEHLFFDCPFSQQVWSRVQQVAGLTGAGPSLASIVTHLMPIAKRKSSKSCIGKLVVAAAAYFVWQERNARLFNKVKRSVTDVVDCIISAVRLKLLSCRFKKSKEAILFARLWEIPMSNLK